ncbi:hypothetical protein GQ53DRAFT_836418 [Thozetella sp. PMI_491]|nr:hypothetical protein GQ53DRAFT_836418 [Thozetella sp. PMI_491]
MSLSLLPHELDTAASGLRAVQACAACRKQKRKCDKTLPTCSLCSRMGRPCDYADSQPPPTADDLATLQSRLRELEHRLSKQEQESPPAIAEREPAPLANPRGPLWKGAQANRFPAAMFLDIDCFKWASMTVPRPSVEIPMEVLEVLGRGNTVQDAASSYFESIHCWFPIVSKKRMAIGIPMWDAGPDLAMLFLAMKLVTAPPVQGTRAVDNPLYPMARRFLSLLESSGTVSLQYVQALVLLAIYEMGHAVYPAAWMTVGACSRYADILGIPSFRESTAIMGTLSTWTEAEERRRVWWGIFILDRVISLGNKKRFCAPEPGDKDMLPVSDQAWDDGDMIKALQRPVSTPVTEPAGAFTRLCQAAILVSRTMNHVRTTVRNHVSGDREPPFDPAEAIGLIDDIVGFEKAADNGAPAGPGLLSCRMLSMSALILMLDIYSCPENLRDGPTPNSFDTGPKSEGELEMQVRAVTGLRDVSLRVRDLGVDHLLEDLVLPASLRRASPLCLDALYGSMATLRWLWKESGEESIHVALNDIKQCLVRLSMRWMLAQEYLGMEQHHDITTAMAWRAANDPGAGFR